MDIKKAVGRKPRRESGLSTERARDLWERAYPLSGVDVAAESRAIQLLWTLLDAGQRQSLEAKGIFVEHVGARRYQFAITGIMNKCIHYGTNHKVYTDNTISQLLLLRLSEDRFMGSSQQMRIPQLVALHPYVG